MKTKKAFTRASLIFADQHLDLFLARQTFGEPAKLFVGALLGNLVFEVCVPSFGTPQGPC